MYDTDMIVDSKYIHVCTYDIYRHTQTHTASSLSLYISVTLSHTHNTHWPQSNMTQTPMVTRKYTHHPPCLYPSLSLTHTYNNTHIQHTLTPNRYEAIVTFGRIEETNVNLRLTFFLKTYKSGTSKTTIERENLANVWGHQCRENTQHLYEKKKVLFERIEMSHITSRKCHELHYLNVTNAYHLNLTNTLHVTDTTLECHEHYSKPII